MRVLPATTGDQSDARAELVRREPEPARRYREVARGCVPGVERLAIEGSAALVGFASLGADPLRFAVHRDPGRIVFDETTRKGRNRTIHF